MLQAKLEGAAAASVSAPVTYEDLMSACSNGHRLARAMAMSETGYRQGVVPEFITHNIMSIAAAAAIGFLLGSGAIVAALRLHCRAWAAEKGRERLLPS